MRKREQFSFVLFDKCIYNNEALKPGAPLTIMMLEKPRIP